MAISTKEFIEKNKDIFSNLIKRGWVRKSGANFVLVMTEAYDLVDDCIAATGVSRDVAISLFNTEAQKEYNTFFENINKNKINKPLDYQLMYINQGELKTNYQYEDFLEEFDNYLKDKKTLLTRKELENSLMRNAQKEVIDRDKEKKKEIESSKVGTIPKITEKIGQTTNNTDSGYKSDESARKDMISKESYLLNTRGIIDRTKDTTWFSKFKRFGIIDPYSANVHTKEYVFITKPELNLFIAQQPNPDLVNRSSFFAGNLTRFKEVAQQLQMSAGTGADMTMPFSALLSNAINGSLELPGISADTIDTAANVYGTRMTYRGSSYQSDEQFDFSLDFKDTKFINVYMWFKMYDMYERMKWRGEVSPNGLYVYRKILHDQVSIYKFIVGEDGMTLRYWARITGCMPLSVPRDTFSELPDGEITFSTQWKGHFVSDMDPRILVDFNRLVYKNAQGKSIVPMIDSNYMTNNDWATCPMIYTKTSKSTLPGVTNTTSLDYNSRMNQYYLMWLK